MSEDEVELSEADKLDPVDWYEDKDRRFGTLQEVIEDSQQIGKLQAVLDEPYTSELTRNVAIAVVAQSLLQYPSDALRALINSHLEGIASLENSGSEGLEDCFLIFLGKNHEKRKTAGNTEATEVKEVNAIFSSTSVQTDHPSEKGPPLEITFLSPKTADGILDQATDLLKTLDWSRDDLNETLDNEDLVAIATERREDGTTDIVSVGSIIYDPIKVKRKGKVIMLNQYEFVAGVTRPDARGKGYYQQVSTRLLEELAVKKPEVHIAVGYSNTGEKGVFYSAKKAGRKSGLDEAQQFGFTIRPFLSHGYVDQKPVNDALTYMPGNQIRQIYAKP